jgi:hypothetical protein
MVDERVIVSAVNILKNVESKLKQYCETGLRFKLSQF